MVIMEENRNRNEVIGASNMPYLNSLASQYTDTTSWEGIGHPSEPNYVAIISGSTQGVTDDGVHELGSRPNLAAQLTSAGVPWKGYEEGMPKAGYLGEQSGEYVRKHNPFADFSNANGPNVVPASQFAPDLAEGKLPPFVWYTPNLINDGHDGTNANVNSSLESIVPSVKASSWYKAGGIIIVTWDESATEPNVIATVVVSGSGSGMSSTARGNHYGTLAAIENLYGLPLLGQAAHATPLLITGATGPTGTTTTTTSATTPTPPVVANAAQSNRSWREGKRLASFSRRHNLIPVGTTFSFTLNEQASVSFAFTQLVSGRKISGKCVAQTNRNRRKRVCKRTVTRGTLSFHGHSGVNKVSFQGLISRSKRLPLGSYTLVMTASSAAGQRSTPRQLRFTIVK